jgi:hypothetical protein
LFSVSGRFVALMKGHFSNGTLNEANEGTNAKFKKENGTRVLVGAAVLFLTSLAD